MTIKSIIAVCAACFVLGIVSIILLVNLMASIRSKKRRKSGDAHTRRARSQPKPKKSFTDLFGGTMNLILIIIGIVLGWFTYTMIELFKIYGSVPDTLINCVFVTLTGECGCLGWIKTTKDKYREREWQQEDMKRAKKEAKEEAAANAKTTPSTEEDHPMNNL